MATKPSKTHINNGFNNILDTNKLRYFTEYALPQTWSTQFTSFIHYWTFSSFHLEITTLAKPQHNRAVSARNKRKKEKGTKID